MTSPKNRFKQDCAGLPPLDGPDLSIGGPKPGVNYSLKGKTPKEANLVDYYPGRKPEECTPEADIERMSEFGDAMITKWRKGRKEHGTVVKIDPLLESMNECVDLANYAMDTYFRIKRMRDKLIQEATNGKGS